MEVDWEKQATFSLLCRLSKSHLFNCCQGCSKLFPAPHASRKLTARDDRRLSENALFAKLCVMLKKLSSKYQLYVCGNFLSKP